MTTFMLGETDPSLLAWHITVVAIGLFINNHNATQDNAGGERFKLNATNFFIHDDVEQC